MEKIKILVACHKPGLVYHDEIYTPIHVGRAVSKCTDKMTGMIGDDTGDNISEKNPMYCELTAQYWAWKNLHDVEYIGFCHYRRFFGMSISDNNIHSLFRNADVVMVGVRTKEIVERELVHYVTIEDITIFLMVLKKLHPEYEQDAIDYLWGNRLHNKNMLICRKELFDQYAEWMFGILAECEKYIRMSPYTRQRRAFGYLSEFFMSVFFIHNRCRIKSVKAVEKAGENTPFGVKEKIADLAKNSLHLLIKPYMKKPNSFEEYFLPEVLVGFKQDSIDPRGELVKESLDNPAISVVCPIYNPGSRLGKCIHSILGQDYKNIEVILVNDGSTDGSLKLCQRYARKDNRIIIIDKTNEGRNAARRDGTFRARGEYVFYIDADDYLTPDALRSLLTIARKKDLDMVVGNHDNVFDSWGLLSKPGVAYKYSERVLDGREYMEICLRRSSISNAEDAYMWGCLYRRSCILAAIGNNEEFLFPPLREMYSEDVIFNLVISKYIQSCWLTNKVVYHYRFGGETSRVFPHFTCSLYYYDYRYDTCIQYDLLDSLPYLMDYMVFFATIEAAQWIYFNKTPLNEVTDSFLKDFDQLKVVRWARQHRKEAFDFLGSENKSIQDHTMAILGIIDNDAKGFADMVLLRDQFYKRHHYWKMKLLKPYVWMANMISSMIY